MSSVCICNGYYWPKLGTLVFGLTWDCAHSQWLQLIWTSAWFNMLRMCASALGIYDLNCPSLRRMALSRRSEWTGKAGCSKWVAFIAGAVDIWIWPELALGGVGWCSAQAQRGGKTGDGEAGERATSGIGQVPLTPLTCTMIDLCA